MGQKLRGNVSNNAKVAAQQKRYFLTVFDQESKVKLFIHFCNVLNGSTSCSDLCPWSLLLPFKCPLLWFIFGFTTYPVICDCDDNLDNNLLDCQEDEKEMNKEQIIVSSGTQMLALMLAKFLELPAASFNKQTRKHWH